MLYEVDDRRLSLRPPHPGRDLMFFLANRVGVDRRRAELRVTHPFLHHVQRHAIGGGIDAKAVAQPLGASVGRVRDARLDHHILDDLPYAHTADQPYPLACAAL